MQFSWICSQKSTVFQNKKLWGVCHMVMFWRKQSKKIQDYLLTLNRTESNSASVFLKRISGKSLGAFWFNQLFPFLWEILALVLISKANQIYLNKSFAHTDQVRLNYNVLHSYRTAFPICFLQDQKRLETVITFVLLGTKLAAVKHLWGWNYLFIAILV